ncbi:MAG: ABC transporter ATP-binding protein [Lachnospiraceae bacterium]|nr:ABC transporter ATP-binding protein [Lachnospiraceae bacterium]
MIEIKDLSKNYGDFHLNISLRIEEGRVTGLVGRNGAGKSTAIKSILGLIKPDGGSVTVMGKDSARLTAADKENFGVAFSDSGFSTYLTIRDVVLILENMYKDFDKAAFLDACKKCRLPEDKRLKDFSTGMKARLRVLIACSHRAKLLILDEPTAGLDVVARNEVLDMLRNYLAEDPGRSMLISSHISSDLEGLCDDIYMIHNGKIVLHEETDVIVSEYALLKLTPALYETIDKKYLLVTRKEPFGYSCLTNQRRYYAENYPNVVMEAGNVDDLIIMLSKEE